MATESPSALPDVGHAPVSTTKSLPFKCPHCNARQKDDARNLVVCIDGTANKFGQKNTNVVKLFAKIDKATTGTPRQHVYYSSGIGTGPKPFNVFGRMGRAVSDTFDMAMAWNVDEIVKDAYGWLARTYKEGDRIYLFGFSRGAYQVRVLAGMIHEVGLITTPTEKQIGTAYEHYKAIRLGKPQTRQIAREFKNTFSWEDTGVHFVGVWDTVSSVGLTRENLFLSTSSSAAHACHFRHALALDERRVKFMPEYFQEMNSRTDDVKSRYIVAHSATPANERPVSTVNESDTGCAAGNGNKTANCKEVWFAGSHADVGGMNRSGKSRQAGNVSLLWMRREATEEGLVLLPTDIVWVPDDLDSGIRRSIALGWRFIEYIPIKHQVSFSGGDDDAIRWHRLQPRRIIPGQKVHASVLFANSYKPQATLGDGFDVPFVHARIEDKELDSKIWETGLFDNTAAQELVSYLGSQQGVTTIYLDRLLFMLRSKEGRQCVRHALDRRPQFVDLIRKCDCASLVGLVTIVTYYEAFRDTQPKTSAPSLIKPSEAQFNAGKKCLSNILSERRHRDVPRVLTLLRSLMRHQVLRECILTQEVLQKFVGLLDHIVDDRRWDFGPVMDVLNSLLQFEDTRMTLIESLEANSPKSNTARLSRILDVNNPHLLTAALRMVLTLAQIGIQEAGNVCLIVKSRIRKLAKGNDRLIGLLAVEILLALQDQDDRGKLDIRDAHAQTNFANALVRLNPERQDSTDGQDHGENSRQQILCQLFGLDSKELSNSQKKLIRELKNAAVDANAPRRTAATMTLLKLCEIKIIRTYLLEINVVCAFVDQLRRKDRALLAAYALADCMKHDDMKKIIKDNDRLPKNIVCMLQQDFFDDAVGSVEGFQIFGDFMQDSDLRVKIRDFNITGVLCTKLGNGKSKEIRTSLICLDIFQAFDEDHPWTGELVKKSLENLRNPQWKVQKAGVTILSALAQTDHGVAAISPRIHEIIEMLLPEEYLLIPTSGASFNEDQTPPATVASECTDPRPPSRMLGPACALRILARNKILREQTRETVQYGSLKQLYLSEVLVHKGNTSPWRVWTPNRSDVTDMLDKMIKAVDGELSEEGLFSIGDAVLPHIRHWDRLGALLRNHTVAAAVATTILPVGLGISALVILATVVLAPISLLSLRAAIFVGDLIPSPRRPHVPPIGQIFGGKKVFNTEGADGEHEGQTHPELLEVASTPGGDDGAGPSGEHSGNSPHGVETTHTQGAGDSV